MRKQVSAAERRRQELELDGAFLVHRFLRVQELLTASSSTVDLYFGLKEAGAAFDDGGITRDELER